MAYASSGNCHLKQLLLGHLKVIDSDWIRSLIDDFESNDAADDSNYNEKIWNTIDLENAAEPLKAYLGSRWFICSGLQEGT